MKVLDLKRNTFYNFVKMKKQIERKIKMTKEKIQSILDDAKKIFERRLAQANATHRY